MWRRIEDLVILSLATYRLAQLVSIDDGPVSVFSRLRRLTDNLAKAEQDEREGRQMWQNINEGIHCPYCVGMWAAVLLAMVYKVWSMPVYLLAIAGGQAWLEGKR